MFFFQIVTVIQSEVLSRTGCMVHFIGAILISITSQQHFPTIRNPKYCICQNYSRRKILSWSTTWHILKNSVWFEHSKCTHIDRCSRRLFPSPANKQRAHTKVFITGLEEWDKHSPFCSFSRTICYCAVSSFLASKKDDDRR